MVEANAPIVSIVDTAEEICNYKDNPRDLITAAWFNTSINNKERAEYWLEKAIQYWPTEALGYTATASIKLSDLKLVEALNVLNQAESIATKTNESAGSIAVMRSKIYERAGMTEVALRFAGDAAVLLPTESAIVIQFARLLDAENHHFEAIKILNCYVKEFPTVAEVWILFAKMLFVAGEIQAAILAFGSAVTLTPDVETKVLLIGALLADSGNTQSRVRANKLIEQLDIGSGERMLLCQRIAIENELDLTSMNSLQEQLSNILKS
jgi:predicted Zn-dependent protease